MSILCDTPRPGSIDAAGYRLMVSPVAASMPLLPSHRRLLFAIDGVIGLHAVMGPIQGCSILVGPSLACARVLGYSIVSILNIDLYFQ